MLLENYKEEKTHLQYLLKKFVYKWTQAVQNHNVHGSMVYHLRKLETPLYSKHLSKLITQVISDDSQNTKSQKKKQTATPEPYIQDETVLSRKHVSFQPSFLLYWSMVSYLCLYKIITRLPVKFYGLFFVITLLQKSFSCLFPSLLVNN